MNRKKANIKDVAKKAGISPSTVSNYINNTIPISKKTSKRIEEAIKELNYIPDNIARGLRLGRTKSIGIIFAEIADPFYSSILNGIEEIAAKNGYSVLIACNNYDAKREKEQTKNLLSNNITGLVFGPGGMDEDIIGLTLKAGIPFVTVDRKISDKNIFSVEIDNFKSFYEATTYLIKKGHKDIYLFSEPIIMGTLEDRFEGYKKALIDNGIKLDEKRYIFDKSLQMNRADGGYEIMQSILKNNIRPDAVITTADSIAIGAMKAAIDYGLGIPEDISFIGNNNSYLSKYMNPSLTTIRQPKIDLGRTAMKLLVDLIDKKQPLNNHIFLETKLIERESVSKRI